jgi:hypothetical protein
VQSAILNLLIYAQDVQICDVLLNVLRRVTSGIYDVTFVNILRRVTPFCEHELGFVYLAESI